MKIVRFITLSFTALLMTGTAFADGHLTAAVSARQSLMRLYGFNISTLGGMAQGKIDYDATAAQAAASNLLALSKLNQSAMWPEGSDSTALGDVTRAKASIWSSFAEISANSAALEKAAEAMDAAAGQDLASLQGAMRSLGTACGVCHEAFRDPQ